MVISKALASAISILKRNNIDGAEFEVRQVFQNVLGLSSSQLVMNYDKEISDREFGRILAILEKRVGGYPLQYLLGEWEFYGLPFVVGEGVLIPRGDTEALVEHSAKLMENVEKPTIYDLCSGSGCIAIALDSIFQQSEVTAVEKSEKAFTYLEKNISLNKANVRTIKADVLDEEAFSPSLALDMVVSNPPYLTEVDMNNLQREVAFEPKMALFGGSDGLDFYREITRVWKKFIKVGGYIVFEIGINQENDVGKILSQNGFLNIEFIRDLCGVIRVVSGKKS